jgi:hypothetical protein
MVEAVVSIAIVSIGILSLLTLLPSSWRLASRSDFIGRASGILGNRLQTAEAMILNPATTVTEGTTVIDPYYPGDQVSAGAAVKKEGDVPFSVATTLTSLDGGVGNAWLVSVRVTWPGTPTGISESLRVIRQENYRQ